uniref:Putative secreted peptide n=1 Tax=Anopheles braziliensis TaxID=58242 RepID=A0A2M3ZWN2_9DIPT
MALTLVSSFCSVSSTVRCFSVSCSNRWDKAVYLLSSSCFRSVEPSCMVRLSFWIFRSSSPISDHLSSYGSIEPPGSFVVAQQCCPTRIILPCSH